MENREAADSKAFTIWDGLAATLIHDIGKVGELTSFAKKSARGGKTLGPTKHVREMIAGHLPEGEPFPIPDAWLSFITNDKEKVPADAAPLLAPAHKLADQVSKQMQGERYSRLEDGVWLKQLRKVNTDAANKLDRNRLPTHFYGYFGPPKLWDLPKPEERAASDQTAATSATGEADNQFGDICQALKADISTQGLLRLQEKLEDFPHSRYVPHLSLALHDLFAASLFYFAYLELKAQGSPERLERFGFCAVEVIPDLLDVFYRLRDVLACVDFAKKFQERAFAELFQAWVADIPGMTADANPFIFYHKQGFVFLYPDLVAARHGLSEALNAVPAVRKAELRALNYSLAIRWTGNGWHPGEASVESVIDSLPALTLREFTHESGQRCQCCGRPVAASSLAADSKGDMLCPECHELRAKSSGIDIDLISWAGYRPERAKPEPAESSLSEPSPAEPASRSHRIAYLFITLPAKLRDHAADVAKKDLIPAFWREHHLLDDAMIPPTQGGIYEYLQALLALQQFDESLERKTSEILSDMGPNAARILFLTPTTKALVMHEDHFWEFLAFVSDQRRPLHLESSVRAVLCPPKTPFWSLVELATVHKRGDILWDVSRETIHMFDDAEIDSIHKLAKQAKGLRLRSQLNALNKVALQTSLKELLLELEYRSDRLKGFAEPLGQAVEALKPEKHETKSREKRAVFFKYIAGITR